MLRGVLAYVIDAADNKFIRNYMDSRTGGPVHIGLSTDVSKPLSSNDPQDWYWYSLIGPRRPPGPYENWQRKDGVRIMPDANLPNCGWMLPSGEWANGACDTPLPYLCQVPHAK